MFVRRFNPFLTDRVDRVCRDLDRKLSRDDWVFGTIRIALKEGIDRKRFVPGAAMALQLVQPGITPDETNFVLRDLWKNEPDTDDTAVISSIKQALNLNNG